MASNTIHQDPDLDGIEAGDQYITSDDVLAEVPDDGDHPMDEDDDGEDDDIVGELPGSSSSGEDNSVQAFPNHQASVFAVSMHPTEALAASGGEDDFGYIWDITDGEVIVKLTGHSDSVTSTAWSRDGELIATGGMDGKVRIWRRVGTENYRTWEFLTELQGPDEVMFLRWHPKGSVLLAGSNDSTLWLWQLPSGNTMQVFAGHTGAVQCGEFTPDGKKIVSACADGTLIYWDPRQSAPIFKLSADDARFNLDGITSLGVNFSSTLAVVGGAAGGVRVVSLSKGEVVATLGGHTEGESIEAVQFIDLIGNNNTGPGIVATGATDGKIYIWDLSTMRLRTTLEHEDAVTSLLALPPPKTYLLVSSSADKTLRTWDARTGTLIQEHKGHQGPVLGASLGLDGSVVVSAGDDGVCLVFTTEEAEEP
ncbi:WD40 repeat-like protein [Guyanagaster necrorhizus]|uniref:WD40 repeat-like protein n=1 Tax=Guyanagaster necrorhizus TaxID=856835 RepID=A0A9P8AX25_9AGAR|nr:WD40 repeat-like protein [Guyanagaster necrorhizus MCA 3950]KAG7451173.1 WD40 repeat-like protein [Guyanagaster necrorhizus MCA 3950]